MGRRLGISLCVLVVAACAASGDGPEPRGSREPAEAPRETTPRSQAQHDYLVTRPDLRKCAYPLCGGVFVAEVNRGESTCADGQTAPDCYVSDIDVSALGLEPEAAGALGNAARAGTVLLRGAMVTASTPYGPIAQLEVTAAWRGVRETTPHDPIYLVVDSGIVCITYPCPSLSQLLLNDQDAQSLSGLDLSTSGASQADVDAAYALLGEPGLMVAGTHVTVTGPGGQGQQLEASEFYLPVATKDDGGGAACAQDPCDTGAARTAGCVSCGRIVCNVDPFCCDNNWDGLCVKQAAELCNACQAPACEHSECAIGDALEVGCSSCAAEVCAQDPFCCDGGWDALCVEQVPAACGQVCAPPAPSCAHSECKAGDALEADCSSCAGVVCQSDGYCCDTAWDALCVQEAGDWCADLACE